MKEQLDLDFNSDKEYLKEVKRMHLIPCLIFLGDIKNMIKEEDIKPESLADILTLKKALELRIKQIKQLKETRG